MKHVSAGEAGVWAIAKNGKSYFRQGIASSTPAGTRWVRVSGRLLQVDSGPSGVVYAIDSTGKVRCRAKITDQKPQGSFWRTVPDTPSTMSYVSCGSYGCWATNSRKIWFRDGVSKYLCKGTNWETVPGSLRQFEVGDHGELWGIHSTSTLWNRVRVSADHPTGKGWRRVGSFGFKHVTVGRPGLFVVTNQGNAYRKHFCTNETANHCTSSPCRNGGVCTNSVHTYKCQCNVDYTGRNCQHKTPVTRSWVKLRGDMKHIDTGVTNSLWGINHAGQPFVFNNHTWVPVDRRFTQISSGQAGVWAIEANKHVFYRAGITHLNPTGMKWTQVGGSLDQVDSGPAGIVYGIENHNLYCRSGIEPGSPTGLLWKRILGTYKHVTCGSEGCWVITTTNKIKFRFGITADFCKGKLWITVPSSQKMVHIEAGSNGSLWGVADDGRVWYREGVDELHPYGQRWIKLSANDRFTMVTADFNGEYALKNSGDVYYLKSKLNYIYALG